MNKHREQQLDFYGREEFREQASYCWRCHNVMIEGVSRSIVKRHKKGSV